MNKRKLISIALCAAVCVGSTISLASCNNTANDTSSKTTSTPAASTASETDASENSEESKINSTEESKTESKEESKAESSAEESSKEESKTEESSQESKEESSKAETSDVSSTSEVKVQTAAENIEEFEKAVTPAATVAVDFKDSKTYKSFFEKLSSGDGHFKLTGSVSSGISASMSIEYQKQGDNIYSEMSVMGISSTVVQKDGKTYTHSAMFGDSYLVSDVTEENTAASLIESEGLDSDAMKLLETGTVDIDGKTYNYEKIGNTEDDSTVLVTYFDGDKMTSVEVFSTNGASDSSDKKNLKKTGTLSGEFDLAIDEKLFELNPDYKVLTEEEFYEQASNLFGDFSIGGEEDENSESDA